MISAKLFWLSVLGWFGCLVSALVLDSRRKRQEAGFGFPNPKNTPEHRLHFVSIFCGDFLNLCFGLVWVFGFCLGFGLEVEAAGGWVWFSKPKNTPEHGLHFVFHFFWIRASCFWISVLGWFGFWFLL